MRRSRKSVPSSSNTLPSTKASLPFYARGIFKRVQHFSVTHSLLKREGCYIVGVSGGPDSLCLLDMLFHLSQKYHFRLIVAHVNYQLRGTDSAADEQLVKERAALYHVPCYVRRIPRGGSTSEATLRTKRYAFFSQLLKRYQADAILLAHTQNDQAETFLMRLLRGAGTAGLSAMLPKNGNIIRPLLFLKREEILHYLKAQKLSFRTDLSNFDRAYFRNRIRYELLPILMKNYQPRIIERLAVTAELLASDRSLVENIGHAFPHEFKKNTLSFSRETLLSLPAAHQSHILRFLLTSLFNLPAPTKALLDELLKTLKSDKNKPQTVLFHGLKLERKGDTVRLLQSQK